MSNKKYKRTKPAWNKGKPMSEEQKKKLSRIHKEKGTIPPSQKGRIYPNSKTRQPGYFAFYERQRNLRKMGNGGSHTRDEWETLKAQYNWTCPRCIVREPYVKLTEDHIIPISKGGSNNIENIQPLCITCNSIKKDKLIPKFHWDANDSMFDPFPSKSKVVSTGDDISQDDINAEFNAYGN